MTHDRIQYRMVIEGVVSPAFIHNGPSWFFVDLAIYANGLVDCWEMVDLALFEQKLARGWVTPSVPNGERIHVHDLGSWPIEQGRWALDPRGLREHVHERVRELNPELHNLYDCHGETTRTVGKIRVTKLGIFDKRPVRSDDPAGLRVIRGEHRDVWWQHDGATHLASLRVFADGQVELGRLPNPQRMTLEEVRSAARDGRLRTNLAEGTHAAIHGLGSFVVGPSEYTTDLADFVLALEDLRAKAAGQPDSVARCRAAFEAYMSEPSESLREALRVAYEAVPGHHRMYVGDMDTKDVPIRMIVYGDQELESWSHRIVAREMGHSPLPTIDVPKPRGPVGD